MMYRFDRLGGLLLLRLAPRLLITVYKCRNQLWQFVYAKVKSTEVFLPQYVLYFMRGSYWGCVTIQRLPMFKYSLQSYTCFYTFIALYLWTASATFDMYYMQYCFLDVWLTLKVSRRLLCSHIHNFITLFSQ